MNFRCKSWIGRSAASIVAAGSATVLVMAVSCGIGASPAYGAPTCKPQPVGSAAPRTPALDELRGLPSKAPNLNAAGKGPQSVKVHLRQLQKRLFAPVQKPPALGEPAGKLE